jgi:hypothetical protein
MLVIIFIKSWPGKLSLKNRLRDMFSGSKFRKNLLTGFFRSEF